MFFFSDVVPNMIMAMEMMIIKMLIIVMMSEWHKGGLKMYFSHFGGIGNGTSSHFTFPAALLFFGKKVYRTATEKEVNALILFFLLFFLPMMSL